MHTESEDRFYFEIIKGSKDDIEEIINLWTQTINWHAEFDKDFVFDATEADLNKFDKIIDEVEPGSLRLPVLLKKYIKQNAKLVAFNVDPLFNNAVDGLMYIKIADLPESTVRPVMEEFQAELERKFMENSGDK